MKKTTLLALSSSLFLACSLNVNAKNIELGNGPDAKLIAFTQCSGLKLENIMLGYMGSYTFQQGFSKEERTGLIKRQKGKVSNGCILPSLQSRQVVYLEVDTKKFEAMGSSNDWVMQCVKSASPNEGAVGEKEPKGEWPYTANYLSGKALMLHCGHSEPLAKECAEGSNSSRSGEWDKNLKKRGKTMLSVYGYASTLAPSQGEKLYCQYYNKKTRKSLFAFEYLRLKN